MNEYPDVYFRPEYGLAECARPGFSYLSIRRLDGAFQIPLVVRDTGGVRDAISPYGYSGAYAAEGLRDEDVELAWDSALEELRSRGVVSVFLRHSPLVSQAAMRFPHVDVVRDHATVAMDVRDPSAAWDRLQGRCRTAIRKSLKSGATVEIRPVVEADLASGSDFRRLYEMTMSRASASAFYLFPDSYYMRLREGLGEKLLIALGMDANGDVMSAALFMHHERFMHYHLSGSHPGASRLGLNNLMIWEAAMYSASVGTHLLHLGGGLESGDSLHRFKASFSPEQMSYRATGVVVNGPEYERLTRAMSPRSDSARYFPGYRAMPIE